LFDIHNFIFSSHELLEHWKQVQNHLNAQLQELQNDVDEHIIFVVLVEQLGKNMDEAHKSHSGNKLGHRPNKESNKEVDHIQIFCDATYLQ
jgi:hypothetical protein